MYCHYYLYIAAHGPVAAYGTISAYGPIAAHGPISALGPIAAHGPISALDPTAAHRQFLWRAEVIYISVTSMFTHREKNSRNFREASTDWFMRGRVVMVWGL